MLLWFSERGELTCVIATAAHIMTRFKKQYKDEQGTHTRYNDYVLSPPHRRLPDDGEHARDTRDAPTQPRAMNIQPSLAQPTLCMDHFWNNSGLARLRVLPPSRIIIRPNAPHRSRYCRVLSRTSISRTEVCRYTPRKNGKTKSLICVYAIFKSDP